VSKSAPTLRALARKCRSLVEEGGMAGVTSALNEMALDYDRQADRVERAEARARRQLPNPEVG
jgi:hypothetical protein